MILRDRKRGQRGRGNRRRRPRASIFPRKSSTGGFLNAEYARGTDSRPSDVASRRRTSPRGLLARREARLAARCPGKTADRSRANVSTLLSAGRETSPVATSALHLSNRAHNPARASSRASASRRVSTNGRIVANFGYLHRTARNNRTCVTKRLTLSLWGSRPSFAVDVLFVRRRFACVCAYPTLVRLFSSSCGRNGTLNTHLVFSPPSLSFLTLFRFPVFWFARTFSVPSSQNACVPCFPRSRNDVRVKPIVSLSLLSLSSSSSSSPLSFCSLGLQYRDRARLLPRSRRTAEGG